MNNEERQGGLSVSEKKEGKFKYIGISSAILSTNKKNKSENQNPQYNLKDKPWKTENKREEILSK